MPNKEPNKESNQKSMQFHLSKYVVLLMLSCVISTAQASTIRLNTIDETAKAAELIFEGVVLASESRWNNAKTDIITVITFRVDDVIKGDYAQPTLSLRFAGGQVDNDRVQYQAVVYPQLGEAGIYFVESINRNLINPLVGWSQGHFMLDADNAVMSNQHRAVMSLETVAPAAQTQISQGAASGVVLGKAGETGMSKQKFKQAINAMLASN